MKIDRVLIVNNRTHYQKFILDKKQSLYKNLLRSKNPSVATWKKMHAEHLTSLENTERILHLLGIQTRVIDRSQLKNWSPQFSKYDLIVSMGGDGTFIETSHYTRKTPLLGVNAAPSESTGALCRARLSNFMSLIIDLLSDVQKPIRVPRLSVKINGKLLPIPALNEILFSNYCPGGTSRYLVAWGKTIEEHKSSGFWVATGAGSTAAIRSAGGKALSITDERIQYQVREAFIEKRRKNVHLGGVLAKGKQFKIYSKMNQACLFIDGTYASHPVQYGDKIEFIGGTKPLYAVL